MSCTLLCAFTVGMTLFGGTLSDDGKACGTPTHSYSTAAWRPWNGDPASEDVQEILTYDIWWDSLNREHTDISGKIKICRHGQFCIERKVPVAPDFMSFASPECFP
jgi:hypothetical protein